MGQVYECCWRIYREINVLFRLEHHMFYFLYPFVTYLLTPPCILMIFLSPYKYILICSLVSYKAKYRYTRRNCGLWRWHGHPNWMQHCWKKPISKTCYILLY
jgi:hypothetical protein